MNFLKDIKMKKKNIRSDIGGQVMDIHYDEKVKKLNLELIKVDDREGLDYFEIHIEDWTESKCPTLVRLHIKEAIALKSMIDNLVYDALTED